MPTGHSSSRSRRSLAAHAAFEPLEPRVHLDAATIFQFSSGDPMSQEVDLDGDGDLDLLGWSARTIGLALNNGAGEFGIPRYIGFKSRVHAVVVGDADGDGDLDLGVLTGSRLVRVYDAVNTLADSGPLRRAVTEVERAGLALAFGKFNGDDRPDVVVLDSVNTTPQQSDYRLRLYKQDAQGKLIAGQVGQTATSGNQLQTPYRLSVAQLMHGSTKDEILLDSGYATRTYYVTSRAIVEYEPEREPVPRTPAEASAIGDFNGDGAPDYVSFTNYTEGAFVSVHLFTITSIGQRPPEPPKLYYWFERHSVAAFVGQRISAIGAADVTGDGLTDIVVTLQTSETNLRLVVLPGLPAGGGGAPGFGPQELLADVPVPEFAPVGFFSPKRDVRILGFADTDGDGTLDPVIQTTPFFFAGRGLLSRVKVFTLESAGVEPSSRRDVFSSQLYTVYSEPNAGRARLVSTFVTGDTAPMVVVDVGEGSLWEGGLPRLSPRTVVVPLRA